mgnify:CR=1 FL=1
MIDLAPGHKQGMLVANPVLLAAGAAGCGEAHWPDLELRALGALVAGPVTLQNRAGAPMPRLVESPAGMVLETGSQNRGLHATLRTFAPLWARMGVPVVVQLADMRPDALARCALRLSNVPGVVALEWRVAQNASTTAISQGVEAIAHAGDLPLWVKLPTEDACERAAAATTAGANALVIGSTPMGAALMADAAPWLLQGSAYGLALFPLILHALAQVAALSLPVALIASGNIYTVAQARAALAAGAHALQLDAVAWLEPTFPGMLAAALKAQA